MSEAQNRAYADYEYYHRDYRGELIKTENDFIRCARKATAFVDQLTFGRIKELPSVPDFVKDAVCECAEAYDVQDNKSISEVKSESNDGYSVTYAEAASSDSFRKKLNSIVKTYLANTGLLYRGVKSDDN